ncbi:hypothetical protein SK224_08235 [Microbacterium sp. BG28]|uniref:hypothetical protein n=1 Tax=Microbacterium sp. BG28 TaxID=3097356 RepID=UPI002A5A4334|nr:hypothetical protein [Microbacterium sp. BG28]MDY0829115.1 hypothetical protein [Microbacterium sp. BG28]
MDSTNATVATGCDTYAHGDGTLLRVYADGGGRDAVAAELVLSDDRVVELVADLAGTLATRGGALGALGAELQQIAERAVSA